ncbi:beta-amyrin 28-monooxygenase-like [Impatiens glandulifera]|uniref:beta-amyrin 28-monooxygenase-like n=1 Tax=Impatiens glandulifera TaxID=253017 RepID=UPI001FB136BA|nr:beta-amyrin 28-monooxygenase-like [Impatiens glandulifera]
MEHWFTFAFLLGSAVSLLVIIFTFLFRHQFYQQNPSTVGPPFRPPPGSNGWPLIGENLDYLHKLRSGNLREFVVERMKKYGSKVFTTSIIGQPTAILYGAEGNKFLFSNENKLVKVWYPGSIEKIFAKSHGKSIGDDFVKVRKMLPAFFSSTALQKFIEGTMDNVIKLELEGHWKPNGSVLVRDLAGRYTLGVACRILLGSDDPSMVEKLAEPEKDIATGIISMPIDFPGTALNRALKAAKRLTALLLGVIEKTKIDIADGKVSKTENILSKLLHAKDENGELFKEVDVAAHLAGLIHGGYDPIRSGLTFVMKYLAELPEIYEQVLREQMEVKRSKQENETLRWEDIKKMKYSWNVTQEVFRLMPPVPGTFREVIKEFTYGGYTIPKGYKIHWNAYSTQLDPEYFSEPEKFDPSRFDGKGPPPFSYVPYGGGPRMCPGIDYAKAVILVFIHNVVTRYRWELLIPDEKVVVDPHPRPIEGLPIRLHPHDES